MFLKYKIKLRWLWQDKNYYWIHRIVWVVVSQKSKIYWKMNLQKKLMMSHLARRSEGRRRVGSTKSRIKITQYSRELHLVKIRQDLWQQCHKTAQWSKPVKRVSMAQRKEWLFFQVTRKYISVLHQVCYQQKRVSKVKY